MLILGSLLQLLTVSLAVLLVLIKQVSRITLTQTNLALLLNNLPMEETTRWSCKNLRSQVEVHRVKIVHKRGNWVKRHMKKRKVWESLDNFRKDILRVLLKMCPEGSQWPDPLTLPALLLLLLLAVQQMSTKKNKLCLRRSQTPSAKITKTLRMFLPSKRRGLPRKVGNWRRLLHIIQGVRVVRSIRLQLRKITLRCTSKIHLMKKSPIIIPQWLLKDPRRSTTERICITWVGIFWTVLLNIARKTSLSLFIQTSRSLYHTSSTSRKICSYSRS